MWLVNVRWFGIPLGMFIVWLWMLAVIAYLIIGKIV